MNLSAHFTGTIQPTRVPLLYRAGLALVALGMILLPMIYIALIFGMGKLVWWHLENDLAIFDHAKGRAAFLALVVYLGPAVAGGIFVLFLIKPLFSRAAAGGEPFRISEKTEPHLFALVGKVCDLVGAPHPKEIRLDNNVNAAAAFRKGWLSFFSNDLMLIIGIPLIAGMTTRQVVGVLAHEFGHFAQGGGMRFSYIIRSINNWFARVVYQRDAWDERLENWARTDEWWLKIIMQLAKGGVWLGRKILWCLMQVGHGMSCFMSRQMEYDADSYEAKIAGSEEFAKTAERLRVLSAAHHAAMSDVFETFQQQELPEDLAALTMWRESTMPADVRNKINEAAVHAKTGWGDTHPADADRIASVTKLRAAGVFHQEGPATELFVDYPSLSKAVTRHYFATEVGVNLEKVQFQNMDLVLRDRQSADEASRHLDTIFGKRFYASRLQPLPASASVNDGAAAAERMQSLGAKYEKDLERYDELQQRLGAQTLGRDLTSVDFTLPKPDDFFLPSSLTSQAEAAIRLTVSAASLLETDLLPFDQAASTRLAAMLTLSGTQSELSDVERAHRHRLVIAYHSLISAYPQMVQAIRASRSLNLLFENASNHHDGPTLERGVKAVATRIEVAVGQVKACLGTAQHPFATGYPPLANALDRTDASDNEYTQAFKRASVCSDAFIPLLVRITGELCGIALSAERTALDQK